MTDLTANSLSPMLLNVSQSQVNEALRKKHDMQRIEEAAQDFEAVFFSEMMKPMFENLKTADGFTGGGKGEEVFQGLMIQEYGKMMAETNSIGIADQVKAHLIKAQEVADKRHMSTQHN